MCSILDLSILILESGDDMTCTFFGNRNAPNEIRSELEYVLTDLIENHSVEQFYVGNNGNFDRLVRGVLRDLQGRYPHIRYFVVLAYMPTHKSEEEDAADTVFPDGLESVPQKFAIAKRNEWMMSQADLVIAYVAHTHGGAYKTLEYARRKKKQIVNLAE